MSVPLSYITVILIWTTTPLAIKWSSEGAGFVFAVTSRMMLGAVLAMVIVMILRLHIPRHRQALMAYLYSGLGIGISMMFVYWGAQYIPSGWVSLIFALSPITTGLLMYVLQGEKEFSKDRLCGLLIGMTGLAIIFSTGLTVSVQAVMGIMAVLASTVIYSFTAIKIKQHNDGIPALTITAAGLMFAVPLYSMYWYLVGDGVPQVIATRAGISILYLALFGSVLGFALFFYILRHVSATRVSLITLVTPVTALLLGRYLNNEPLTLQIASGAMLILAGLAFYEFGVIARWFGAADKKAQAVIGAMIKDKSG